MTRRLAIWDQGKCYNDGPASPETAAMFHSFGGNRIVGIICSVHGTADPNAMEKRCHKTLQVELYLYYFYMQYALNVCF